MRVLNTDKKSNHIDIHLNTKYSVDVVGVLYAI